MFPSRKVLIVKMWFGLAGNSIGFVALTDDKEKHELWFFHSRAELFDILQAAEESSSKNALLELVKCMKMQTESEERAVVLRGDVVHMVAYFLKPVFENFKSELLTGTRSKRLLDNIVKEKHPETIFVPPRDDDLEPAGLLFNPAQSAVTFFFSQEQGEQLLERRSSEEEPADKDRLLETLRSSVLPQHSEQLPMNLGDPFGYYLFCGYLLQKQQSE